MLGKLTSLVKRNLELFYAINRMKLTTPGHPPGGSMQAAAECIVQAGRKNKMEIPGVWRQGAEGG